MRNYSRFRVISGIKQLIVRPGRRPREIKGGLIRGLNMHLDLASQTQRWLGLDERELYRWFKRVPEGIRTACDIGASEGMYTLYFLARTPAERVFAFEPSVEAREILESNLEINRLAGDPRLVLSAKFVGGRKGDPNWISLDQALSSARSPCLIKMDIDGGEVDVLQSAPEILLHLRPFWIIETHSVELEQDCCRILRGAGYNTTIIPNAWWRCFVPELRPIPHNRWLVAVPGND